MANIYEITQDYLTIMRMMEDPELDPQTLADTLEAVEGELEVKAENYAKIMRNLEGDIVAIKAEIDRLSAKKRAIENNIKFMKETLQEAMIITGKTKIKTDLFDFNIQRNVPSVVIDTDDVFKIPDEYLKYKEPEVDKAAIKEAIKKGADLTGIAHLEQGSSLRIR